MRCKATAQGAKEYHIDHYDDYIPARDEAFTEEVMQEIENYLANIDEDSTPSFADFCEIFQDEFKFKDIDEWLGDSYEGMLGDCADQRMEEERERGWEEE